MMRAALGAKLLALALALPVGVVLMGSGGGSELASAIGGAWMINLLFIVSTLLTMALTLPVLRRKAQGK
jgi:hypothetical protein